jgi:predicted nucleic acid-binding protein
MVRARTPREAVDAATAASLFGQCEIGLLEFTTNAAIIAEVVFILSSRRHYSLSRTETVSRLLPLLQLAGCILPDKEVIMRALGRWQASDKLSFVDTLVIEQSISNGAPLASFDRHVRAVDEIMVWRDD